VPGWSIDRLPADGWKRVTCRLSRRHLPYINCRHNLCSSLPASPPPKQFISWACEIRRLRRFLTFGIWPTNQRRRRQQVRAAACFVACAAVLRRCHCACQSTKIPGTTKTNKHNRVCSYIRAVTASAQNVRLLFTEHKWGKTSCLVYSSSGIAVTFLKKKVTFLWIHVFLQYTIWA